MHLGGLLKTGNTQPRLRLCATNQAPLTRSQAGYPRTHYFITDTSGSLHSRCLFLYANTDFRMSLCCDGIIPDDSR
ncbi:uncharacterized protein METZ01_LOCUS402285, partial [marine metagenome]